MIKIYFTILLLAISTCNATTDVASSNQKPEDSTTVESSRKSVRATSGTADPGSNNIPFHLNSLSSNQDGQSKQPQTTNNNNNHVAHSSLISHANGQSAPPPSSHHQLQQYVRAFTALPKDLNFQKQKTSHQLASLGQRSPVISIPPGATGGTGGYILSMNTETGQTLTSSGLNNFTDE